MILDIGSEEAHQTRYSNLMGELNNRQERPVSGRKLSLKVKYKNEPPKITILPVSRSIGCVRIDAKE